MDRSDVVFLAEYVADEELRMLLLEASSKPECDRLEVAFRQDQIETMLCSLADLLSESGLDASSEPNALGQRVEELIDLFNRQVWPDEE